MLILCLGDRREECSKLVSRIVEQLLTAASYWFPSSPAFLCVLYVNYGVPRQHFQVTLEYPMDPLRHGGIDPIHISTTDQLCRCVFNIPSACHSFYLQSINFNLSIPLIGSPSNRIPTRCNTSHY
jgi:hypothetical protein